MDAFAHSTGRTGAPWERASRAVSQDLGVLIRSVVMAPGRPVNDLYYDWSKLREVQEDGAILVRPDKFIGWRAMDLPDDPPGALRDAMAAILGLRVAAIA